MNLFRNKKEKERRVWPVAIKINNGITAWQARTAEWLNVRTVKFSRRQQLGFLIAVCLLLGGGSLYLLCKAIL
ncbi:hypothetical protein [Mucilaginibacter pocheonensis]|uniref:Uncharacterized protein n=1 Tax=Mucilaginibacter pocheonensis TaxID=398050 RepID=A0ABU1T819_9SPHI|nr:hypothetical protein [Mucilaginibacter pocheonensis]MDR6941381.1 hypothetical protein [Mucilaginibacter pocheonensis]